MIKELMHDPIFLSKIKSTIPNGTVLFMVEVIGLQFAMLIA